MGISENLLVKMMDNAKWTLDLHGIVCVKMRFADLDEAIKMARYMELFQPGTTTEQNGEFVCIIVEKFDKGLTRLEDAFEQAYEYDIKDVYYV